VNNFLNKLK